jgi:hypothetical protein
VVADRCQQQTFGRLEGGAEIRGLQIKRNAEHHEAEDDVQDRQRGGLKCSWTWSMGSMGVSSLLGTDLQAGHLDIVGMLLLSCDTLGDGLEVLTEYAPIIGDNARFEIVQEGAEVQLRYLPDYVLCLPQRVEAVMGCVVSLARWMTNGRFRSRAVLLAHTPRTDPAAYEALLGCPVRFDQTVNAVCMDASELNHALVQAGSSLHQHLRALADGMLASLAQDGVSARVQKLLLLDGFHLHHQAHVLGKAPVHAVVHAPLACGRWWSRSRHRRLRA